MSLSITSKIAIGGASLGGISGAVAYAHHELSKITLAEKLKGTLIEEGKKKAEKIEQQSFKMIKVL